MRRGWVWPIEPAYAAPELETQLRQLRALARTGLPGDDDDLVVADGREKVVAALRDRQVGRVRRRREVRSPLVDPACGVAHRGANGGVLVLRSRPIEAPAEPVLVPDHEAGQPIAQVLDVHSRTSVATASEEGTREPGTPQEVQTDWPTSDPCSSWPGTLPYERHRYRPAMGRERQRAGAHPPETPS